MFQNIAFFSLLLTFGILAMNSRIYFKQACIAYFSDVVKLTAPKLNLFS